MVRNPDDSCSVTLGLPAVLHLTDIHLAVSKTGSVKQYVFETDGVIRLGDVRSTHRTLAVAHSSFVIRFDVGEISF